ncbi:hypothetical protein Scel_23580 [Streptomyces cellostaticus]|nr:hypothetical protein Scel_23580 [Streptomyces cellostaticus]
MEYLRLRADQWDHNRYNVEQAGGENLGRTQATWGRPGHPEEFENLSQCASFMTTLLERSYGADTAYGWATSAYFNQYFPPKDGSTRTTSYPQRRGSAGRVPQRLERAALRSGDQAGEPAPRRHRRLGL